MFRILTSAACLALVGCSSSSNGLRSDAGGCPQATVADGSQPLFLQSCGGTATATGTSPLGAFAAAAIGVSYHCGTIYLELPDETGYARLTLSFPYAGGIPGERTATVTFQGPPRGDVLVQTTGSITITAISAPFPGFDAGVPPSDAGAALSGMIEGTFSVGSSCLSISGSFASHYCSYDSLCG
jgi:hypothetical protein